ncbi:hypothetical protein OEZ85_008579 [Tetradesmus obliquus]|uniref:Uncharacterized protein n=1 Tax=Tetradesmus obliquus TaxID=3088 RepID=A0ABY8TNW5_TETOB|nr:hypothetical protein OEZ85_008579 [Tetradesmus obliquus]
MSSCRMLQSSCWVPRVSKPQQRALRPLHAQCLCKLSDGSDQCKPLSRQPARVQLPVPLPRLLAGCGAAAASLLLPLLPAWASDSFDYTDTYLDSSVAESPDILGTLLIVVVTYFTVMLLYLWLSSFLDEEDAAAGGSNGKQQSPSDRAELPPSYGEFLDAHVRSYVAPGAPRPGRVAALRELGQGQPLEGEDLPGLKARLAAGAAEALDQQMRDCERLVRTKLLSRKLGFGPARTAAASQSSSSSSGDGVQQRHQPDVAALLSATVLSSPGGLSSPAHRAEIDKLIEQHLDDLLPPGNGSFQDDLVVRQVLRRLVGTLVVEEALLLLEGVDAGRRALEEGGGAAKPASKHWALW